MNKFLPAALAACLAVPCLIIAQGEHSKSHTVSKRRNHKIRYGIASFYANKFNGRHTASGEVFSQEKLTAASNVVPLNTWVRVTNLRNKKKVNVRINDRMYFRNKRLIDLSHAAAKKLGYSGWGLAKVKVEILGREKLKDEFSSVK
jgi:rare lipoprotein A